MTAWPNQMLQATAARLWLRPVAWVAWYSLTLSRHGQAAVPERGRSPYTYATPR
jgi:hypothetical protein